jgi:DNA-binding IclR family transcriptional regulator
MCAYQDKVVFIDQVAGTHRLTAVSAIGVSFPLHCSANGKALLAALGDEDIGKRKRRIRLSANTPNSITTWDRLDREIAAIRKQGVAYDREENSIGISAVATVIRSPTGEMAALSVPVPTQRFDSMERELTSALLKHAGRLQRSGAEALGRDGEQEPGRRLSGSVCLMVAPSHGPSGMPWSPSS